MELIRLAAALAVAGAGLVVTLDWLDRLYVSKLPNGRTREVNGSQFRCSGAKLSFMMISRLFLLLVASLLPLAASAQWQWLDSAGKKVFSDRPPPAEIPDKNIIRQPRVGARSEAAAPVAAAASAAAKLASAPKLSGKDSELEAKKKQAEQEEAAKKKADEEKLAADRASNCTAAKGNLASMQSGRRMQRTNANGEPEIMTDEARAAEAKRMQEVIARDCVGGTVSSAK